MLRTTLRTLRPLARRARVANARPSLFCESRMPWLTRPPCSRGFSAVAARNENDGGGSLLVMGMLLAGASYYAWHRYDNRVSRTNPQHLLNESLEIVKANEEVHRRLGSKLVGRGDVVHTGGGVRSSGGTQIHIERIKVTDKDGRPCLRVRYNLFGPRGYASVFVEAAEDSKDGEYNFIYVQFADRHDVLTIVDPADTAGAWQS